VGELAHETAGMANAALLLIDIDHFKGVNDTYGHLFGDKVLRAVAHVLQANIKGRDLVARMGGEEFAILFVQATASGALAVAEQIRTAVAQGRVRSVAGEDLTGAVTVSAGLAVSLSGDSLENLIERADSALYEAKRSGRNRVCVAAAPAR
jgi:diguanylate cyclase